MDLGIKSQILLVDDKVSFTRQFSKSLSRRCGIQVLTANSAEDALRIVREQPIKVVILDQKMPTKGTVLLPQIRRLNPKIRSILLTAESDQHDMRDAHEVGFNVTLLKEDEDLEKLPMKILLQIDEDNTEQFLERTENTTPLFTQERHDLPIGLFGRKYQVEYRVLYYESIEDNFVNEKNWKNYMRIQRGQTISRSESEDVTKEVVFDDTFRLENEQGLSIGIDDIAEFKASLSMKMSEDLKIKYSKKKSQILTKKIELKIPDNNSDIISIDYEYAQSERVIRVYLEKVCSCCQSRTVEPITVYIPIPELNFRIKENYQDGTVKVIPDGGGLVS